MTDEQKRLLFNDIFDRILERTDNDKYRKLQPHLRDLKSGSNFEDCCNILRLQSVLEDWDKENPAAAHMPEVTAAGYLYMHADQFPDDYDDASAMVSNFFLAVKNMGDAAFILGRYLITSTGSSPSIARLRGFITLGLSAPEAPLDLSFITLDLILGAIDLSVMYHSPSLLDFLKARGASLIIPGHGLRELRLLSTLVLLILMHTVNRIKATQYFSLLNCLLSMGFLTNVSDDQLASILRGRLNDIIEKASRRDPGPYLHNLIKIATAINRPEAWLPIVQELKLSTSWERLNPSVQVAFSESIFTQYLSSSTGLLSIELLTGIGNEKITAILRNALDVAVYAKNVTETTIFYEGMLRENNVTTRLRDLINIAAEINRPDAWFTALRLFKVNAGWKSLSHSDKVALNASADKDVGCVIA